MYLMRRIELFMKRADMAPTRVGREAINDPRLVNDLKNGRALRPKTLAQVVAWLDEQEKK